jgi:oxalate---CoA ligase
MGAMANPLDAMTNQAIRPDNCCRAGSQNPPTTIADAIRLQAVLHPHRAAVFCAGFPALSFGELDRAIRAIGDDLHASGIGAASRVGIMLPNGPEAALIAVVVCAHAIGYPLDPELTAADFEPELDRIGLDAVILPDWTALAATAVVRSKAIGIIHASKASRSLADVCLSSVVAIPVERRRTGAPSRQSVAIIQTSSGSTGLPKHVLVTHANVLDVAGKVRSWFGVSESDRSACIAPVHSALGFKVALLAPLLTGSSVVITQKQQAEDITHWCADHDPTWFFAVPTYLGAVLDRLRATGRLEHTLRFFLTGGTYFPEALRTELEAILGIPGLEQYGSRETGPISANPAPPAMRKPATVGPISADVGILDDDGAVLPHGTSGAVAVRGQGVSPGYIEALPPGADIVPNGRSPEDWLPTGDLGIVDPDGFLSIVGRAKQIINRGGEKIAPSEVEKALLAHQAVRYAVSFGVPHPRLGEAVSAAVVLHPQATAAPTELQSFLYERLPPFKIPQRIHIVSALPRTLAGKISMSKLKELFSATAREFLPAKGNLEILLVDIWERLLDRPDIGVDDNFFELGGDSLLATSMLLEVEAQTRHPVPPSALRGVWTVRQLARALLSDAPADRQLITRAKEGSGTPFFFCHGDYRDRGIYAFRLMDLVKADVPILLLNHWRDFLESRQDSLEDIARLYMPELLASQPNGPFRIGGYCIGGLLAWEIARQLTAAGREVERVVLVDSPSLNGHAGLRATKRTFDAIARVAPERMRLRIERSGMWSAWVTVRSRPAVLGALTRLSRYLAFKWRAAEKPRPVRWDEYRRLSNYIPPKLDTGLLCLVCADNARRVDFRPSNWRRLARSVRARVVPGDHHSCITTHADAVAAEMQYVLERK